MLTFYQYKYLVIAYPWIFDCLILQLLVEWTRGKNLIVTSSTPFVSEIRGPCDVANLLSFLGLTCERAKTAVSKNCRYANLNYFHSFYYCALTDTISA